MEIKARFDAVPGLYLRSVEQKDAELVIKGESPNEASVTRFGQSMEFSSGLFTNLNIETQREMARANKDSVSTVSPSQDSSIPGLEVVAFTIKCNYAHNSVQPNATTPATPTNHVAKN